MTNGIRDGASKFRWAMRFACVPIMMTMAANAAQAEEGPAPVPALVPLETAGYQADDKLFAAPYVDADEMRSDGETPYRYVHGGFTGTDTRFAFHFPLAENWDGRFFQYVTPVPDSENLTDAFQGGNAIGMAIDSGAYFVSTNGGGAAAAQMSIGADQSVGAYRANAASARFSRHVARQIYGIDDRIYGYIYGGSGGAYRTIGGIENSDAWDGAVPYVIGSPMAIPNMFTVRLHAMRVVGEKLDDVVDALDAGGSGDVYATLNDEEAAALKEVTRMGMNPESWYAWRTMGPHAFALLFGGIRMADASYFTDFWTKPGYAGHDRPELYAEDRVQLDTSIAEVITADEAEAMGLDIGRSPGTARGTADMAWQAMGLGSAGEMPVAFRLADAPRSDALLLSDLILPSGKKLLLSDVKGDIAIAGINAPDALASAKAGDSVRLDNSDILAVQTYHRHQVPPGDDYPTWNQFRDAEGEPLFPQRPMLLGPLFTQNATGELPSGDFDGKMIVVENLWDREALPWQADWYRGKVAANLGEAADENFRVWFTDRALHGEVDDAARVVSYTGVVQQALRDLSAWVEDGVAPPESTAYAVADGQVEVAASAEARRGVQPVVTLSVNGSDVAKVEPGKAVRLSGTITAPPGTGRIVAAEWDYDGDGTVDAVAQLPADAGESVTVTGSHSYDMSGTHFAVLRGVSQREGDRETPYARIENLGRARIIVE